MTKYRPAFTSIQDVLEFIGKDGNEELVWSAINWAIAARAKELGKNPDELKANYGVDKNLGHKDRYSRSTSMDAYVKLGIRPEHLLSFAPSIWHDWPAHLGIRLYAGTHAGKWGFSSGRVIVLNDIQGLSTFMRHVEGHIPNHARMDLEFKDSLPIQKLTDGQIDRHVANYAKGFVPDLIKEKFGAAFSFGAPPTSLETALISHTICPLEVATALEIPQLRIYHSQSALRLDGLFRIGPTPSTHSMLWHPRGYPIGSQDDSKGVIEDFGLIGVKSVDPDQNSEKRLILGFAAGITHWGTLAAASALGELIQEYYTTTPKERENYYDLTDGAVAVIRVCLSDASRDSLNIPRKPALTLSNFVEGWNFISPEKIKDHGSTPSSNGSKVRDKKPAKKSLTKRRRKS